jgi:hypothetical protein
VLDQGNHPAGHEASGPDRCAASGQLAHLDHPAPVDHFDPAPGAGGGNLVRLGHAARVDHYLDLVTPHARPPVGRRPRGTEKRAMS